MLAELQVRNLALIEGLSLSFGHGANILTGETGAGKSILAGALGLLRGGRASADMVRAGAEELVVEALFTLSRPGAFEGLFAEQGLPPADEVLIRRKVLPGGRSRAWVNGSLITLAQLSQWGEELLALSGQHDQQSLLNPARQLDFLDGFGGHGRLLKEMAELHRAREAARQKLAETEREMREIEARRDFHEFQLGEIRRVNPRPGEDDELLSLKARAKEGARLAGLLEEAVRHFYGDDGILSRLDRVAGLLDKAAALDASLAPSAEAAREGSGALGDAARTVKDSFRSLGKAGEGLDEADTRLSALSRLKRKYGPTLDDVLKRLEWLKGEKGRLESLGLDRQTYAKRAREAERAAGEGAAGLHAARLKAAGELSRELTATLGSLGFPKVELRIELAAPEEAQMGASAGPKGADQAAFLFCPNPGEGFKPLSRIASGGELSRVMLALKTAQEPHSDQSLVFDEIDSGLSGDTAGKVAAKMAELSARQQVFVITHQPLMAAIPGKHFLAEKSPEGGRTLTVISELDPGQRLREVARMLDGSVPSPQALALSRRLLGQGDG
ncbi:MAG: DNA repair protein RecN [Deltaproteobacteria bacterium]|jgi:DNA repair protein RecN (Recombination protein N)|nr:DNA repair protein RecN [Deltaproteobacteria bacterium]